MQSLTALDSCKINPFTLSSEPHVHHWHNLLLKIQKSKKTLIVTGAGVSCSSGIPDFRSEGGLYQLVKEKYPNAVVKGQDLFDSALFKSPTTTSLFYTFMGELYTLCDKAQVTETHMFIKYLHEKKALLRWYTQNIDGLEHRTLYPSLSDSLVNSSDSLVKMESKENISIVKTKKKTENKIIQLHGDLQSVKCTLCFHISPMLEHHVTLFKDGKAPNCFKCQEKAETRIALGKRAISVGSLRPNVVLYNEYHSKGDDIADMISLDQSKKPNLMIVLGTSLKVIGIKNLVKTMAKTIHQSHGLVILINDKYLGKEWDTVFTHWIEGKCDDVCIKLRDGLETLSLNNSKGVHAALDKVKLDKAKKGYKSQTVIKKVDSVFKNEKKNVILQSDKSTL